MAETQTEYYQPAEWESHEACWLAWPSHADLWGENLKEAQQEFTNLALVIAESEQLEILVPHRQAFEEVQKKFSKTRARFHLIPFGDIWLRDTAPIFLKALNSDKKGELALARFEFNGWGGKYILPFDNEVAANIAINVMNISAQFQFSWVLEGGSVDVDGEGTCLTTEQCLLNPNRGKNLDKKTVEENLRQALGVKTVLWLREGLINDHTDGHIDTLARFVAPGVVVCMEALDHDDPNRDVLTSISEQLAEFVDDKGRQLKVHRIPSPGQILNSEGDLMPASYLNFYISNKTVIVPQYGSRHDQEAVLQLSKLFPQRKTLGLPAKAILNGGGAFHCITQQQPART